ncbi:MAG: helicase-related protein [Gemmatimonadetes bacterium]|nr:helicase-related protein [Gemmatimonadota bacterium]
MTRGHAFIDNRDGNTLANALGALLGVGDESGITEAADIPDQVNIATAFFSPTGFAHIAGYLQPVKKVRLLLGADLSNVHLDGRKRLDETSDIFERRRIDKGLENVTAGLERDRDRLPFSRTSGTALAKLIHSLRAGNMEVRRYEKAFLHAKAYIFSSPDDDFGEPSGIIAGSSNLTGAGLTENLELNLGTFDGPIVAKANKWFNDLWDEAKPYDLAGIFEVALQPQPPWDAFVRVLWQLYGDEVEDDIETDENLPLTSFQKHGVARALRLMSETGGVIVADEVGLGKTFIAGEILQLFRDRRQRALLICPASLRDTTWRRFLNTYQLYVECLSFEQLAGDRQLRDRHRPNADQQHLQRPLNEYQLVIVDEAHNYRNPDAPTRAASLRRLLFGQKRDLLLLTATPVNNSLWDLYHLIRFFLRQDAHLADRGILSIRERFEEAMRTDPSSLSPDVLYPIIDATTVKRTRQFVKKHYAGDTISGPDGRPQPIVFPHPTAISVRYELEDTMPGFFDRLEEALDSDEEGALAFTRYMPEAYLRDGGDGEEDARARAMVGLLRSGLLKRFESSAFAFRKTVDKMADEHDVFLDSLDAGYVVTTEFLREISGDDETVFEDLLEATDERSDASRYDVGRLRQAVMRDRDILRGLAEDAHAITPENDPKLKALTDALVDVVQQAEQEATSDQDESEKRKVIIYSFFEDTVSWIRGFLEREVTKHAVLGPYRDRIVAVSGSGDLDEPSRQHAVHGFAPVSMEAPAGRDADLYDIMIATDVLAEGVNLQQCRHIINYDMPWNPMRLVQRHGRIDRIGSPHDRVFLRTIFPVDRLDQLLNLEQRILGKLAMAAASVGVAAPIEGSAHGEQVFTETREEIEKLMREDASIFERGGSAGAAQTGEEYRQTLRRALDANRDRIVRLPWKIGSGMIKSTRRGVFFCAVVGKETEYERTYLRFVSADADWQPRTGDDAIVSELGTCLRFIECDENTPIWQPVDFQERVYDFWEVAAQDILASWMRETDPANLQPAVRPLNHRVAEFIRANQPPDLARERINRSMDILESPWPRREEIMLRGWFNSEEYAGVSLAGYLIDQILETGLEPTSPPAPLPPIQLEDIELLCWIGIEPDSEKDNF